MSRGKRGLTDDIPGCVPVMIFEVAISNGQYTFVLLGHVR